MLDKVVDIELLSDSLKPYLTPENTRHISDHLRFFKSLLLRHPSIQPVCIELLNKGVCELQRDGYWLSLEVAVQALPHKDDVMFRRCLHNYAKAHKANCKRPSAVSVDNTQIDLLSWYRASFRLGEELDKALTRWDKVYTGARSTCRAKAQLAIQCLKLLCDNHESIKQGLYEHGLHWFNNTYHFNSVLQKYPVPDVKRLPQSHLLDVLSVYAPNRFSSVVIQINHKQIDVSDLAEDCPIMVEQLTQLASNPKFRGEKDHVIASVTRRFIASVETLRKLNAFYREEFAHKGLDAFKGNDYRLLQEAKDQLEKRQFNELVLLLEDHLGHKVHQHEYMPLCLAFFFEKKSKYRTIDYSRIYHSAPNLFNEIKAIHQSEIALIAEKNYSIETLHTRFSKLIRLLVNYVFPDYMPDALEHGVRCLSLNDNRIQKALFQQLQESVKNKSISLRTGSSYMEVMRWLMSITDQPVVEAYKISYKRYQRHARRTKIEDLYTDDELTELIFYIEKSIRETQDRHRLLVLYFAKIQIKSCWNPSPMADIELSDITEVSLPTSKKRITLLIQKPRKGYDTDMYALEGKAVNSVMRDILFVRDKLTAGCRASTATSQFSDYLFIYELNKEIYRLDANNIASHINGIIRKMGCSVSYNSMRIRKNGANHLYRDVSKQMRAYEAAKLHTFDTFINHYQRINESDSQETLHSAIDVMQRYFNGREIDPDIKILMQDDSSTQKTPTGECVSECNSPEALQYQREHRNLIVSSDKKDVWCGDYLACVWCKHFRTVADPEHVWQLLSYRDYVLADMAASTSDIENNDFQKASIDALHNRVNEILEQVEIRNKYAVTKGKELLKRNGIHPFWAFAVTSFNPALGGSL